MLQRKVSAVNRAGGAFSSLNQKRDFSNETRDVSNETRDFSNETRDVGNQKRDVSNKKRDVSNETRDVGNQKRRYHREWFEKAMLDYLKIAFLFISFLQYI